MPAISLLTDEDTPPHFVHYTSTRFGTNYSHFLRDDTFELLDVLWVLLVYPGFDISPQEKIQWGQVRGTSGPRRGRFPTDDPVPEVLRQPLKADVCCVCRCSVQLEPQGVQNVPLQAGELTPEPFEASNVPVLVDGHGGLVGVFHPNWANDAIRAHSTSCCNPLAVQRQLCDDIRPAFCP